MAEILPNIIGLAMGGGIILAIKFNRRGWTYRALAAALISTTASVAAIPYLIGWA